MSGPTEIRRIDLKQGPPGPASTVPGPAPATVTTASFVQPAGNVNVTVTVASSAPWSAGQTLYVEGAGIYAIDSIPDATHMVLTNLDVAGSLAPGSTVASGARITTAGIPGAGTELALTTTDGTATPITFDLSWLANLVTFRLSVVLVVRDATHDKSFTLEGLFRKAGGTITQTGDVQTPSGVLVSASAPAWTAALDTSGSNVRAIVSGAAGAWSALAQIIRVTGAS